MNYVIIGASAAGLTAAKTLRQHDVSCQITIISKDTHIHSRCMLHHYVSHHRDLEAMSFVEPDFFERYNIIWHKGSEVTQLDCTTKSLLLHTGQRIHYDKLLIATGAHAFVPPIPNLRTAKNVFVFRDLSDAVALDVAITPTTQAVVIGAGLVGLDACAALLERGVKTTVIEMADRLLPLQLDAASALTYERAFERNGCECIFEDKVSAIDMDDTGTVAGVWLSSGKHISCDVVVVAAGVRAETSLVQSTPIETNQGIKVDAYLATTVQDVYAAGDVTGLSGIWPNAMKQGQTAALNMLGQPTAYTDRYALKNTINFFGTPTLSLGQIHETEGDCVYIREDHQIYQKIIIRDHIIQGVIFQGNVNHTGIWQHLIKNKIKIDHLEDSLFYISFADFYTIDNKTGKYNWSV